MNNSVFDAQNTFHKKIEVFINGPTASRRGLLSNCIFSRNGLSQQAQELVREYVQLESLHSELDINYQKIKVQPYKGDIPEVALISKLLSSIQKHIVVACVHGSLGTNEVVSYSDFDAIVVLKKSTLSDAISLAKVAIVLRRCKKYMYQFDPLQHHGWFVLTDFDLSSYCDGYFPHNLFYNSESIVPPLEFEFAVSIRPSAAEVNQVFIDVTESILNTNLESIHSSLYEFKSYLSKIMLLPALYLHAATGIPVSKQQSFHQISNHFDKGMLIPVSIASRIRNNWSQVIVGWKRLLLTKQTGMRKIFTKMVRVKVPSTYSNLISKDYQLMIISLITEMKCKLGQS